MTASLVLCALLAGAATALVCDQNPCVTVNGRCCPTYPCNATMPNTVDVSSIFPFELYGFPEIVRLAVDEINSDPAMFPNQTFRVRWQSTRLGNPGATVNAFACTTLSPTYQPIVQLLIGPVLSAEGVQVAQIAGMMNVPVLSGTVAATGMSDKTLYPTFSRIRSTNAYGAVSAVQFISYYGWDQVVVICSPTDAYSIELASTLVSLAPSKGIHVALNLQFNSAGGDDPAAVLQRVVDSKVRVLFVMLTLADWNVLVPVAAQMGLTSASYVWIASSYQYYVNIPNLPVGLIAIGEYLNTSSPMYKSITAKWADAYKANPSNTFGVPTLGLVPILHYNVIKFGAQVLSNLQKGGVPWTPANIIQAIRNTTWPGIGGTVRLKSNGDSPNNVNFANYQVLPDGTKAWAVVGTVFDGQPLRTTSAKVQWGMGRDGDNVPIAAPQTLSTRLEPSPGLTTTMVALASVVVVVAVLVLAFNVYYRSNPYVKMSTPAMNNVVAVGVVLCMAFVYLLAAAPTITSPARFAVNCNARLVCLALGFTLSFGSLFIKTYRVAQIFAGKVMQVVVITLSDLFKYLFALVALDVVFLAVWLGMSPYAMETIDHGTQVDPSDPDTYLDVYTVHCSSSQAGVFSTIMYAYKAVVILIAAFTAFQTRNVSIPALNDSRQIGLSTYISGIVAVIVYPIAGLIDYRQASALFALTSLAVIVSAGAVLLIVFVPKIKAVCDGTDKHLTSTPPPLGFRAGTPNKRTSASQMAGAAPPKQASNPGQTRS
ncbi:G-protein coupled receptors family 3 profile domain-containing protein [Plasmodiophora brassicae]|nr:hypothetical protein PBRA_005752 [Plasmodiophora brassicae]